MKRKILAFLLASLLCVSVAAERRQEVQTATTSAVAWTMFAADDFDVEKITLTFDATPTTAENITVTLDSGQGTAYDAVIAAVDPAGYTDVVITNIGGLKNGDKLLVEYTNTDGNSITGVATMLLDQDKVDGPMSVYTDGAACAPGGGGGASVDKVAVGGTAFALGTGVMAASEAVTIATDDTMFTALDTAVDIIAGDTTNIALDTAVIAGDTTSLDAKTPALGTAAMAGSVPFTLATDDTQFGAVGSASDVDGNIHGQLRSIGEALSLIVLSLPGGSGAGYKSYIDTSFVTGDSPQVHDVNTDLSRNGDQGFVYNDGAGNISIKVSESGAVSTEDAIVLKTNEAISLDGWNVDQIQVTWVADSAYRIVMR